MQKQRKYNEAIGSSMCSMNETEKALVALLVASLGNGYIDFHDILLECKKSVLYDCKAVLICMPAKFIALPQSDEEMMKYMSNLADYAFRKYHNATATRQAVTSR